MDQSIIVPLNWWILISILKIHYMLVRQSDGTINRNLDEHLDHKVPSCKWNPAFEVFSFDFHNNPTGLVYRVYRPATETEVPTISEDAFLLTMFGDLSKPLTTNSKMVPVILFFHGGNFAHHSPNTGIYHVFCCNLAKICQAIVVSLDYHRSPEHRYPFAYNDAWQALQWLKTRTWLQSGEHSKVHLYLAGDDAGGNIAHHVAVRAAQSGVEVLGNILVSPMFGGEMRRVSEQRLDGKYFVKVEDLDWYWRAYLPEGEDRDHPACNIFGPKGISLSGIKFPKSLVVVAGFDPTQDWQFDYVEGLRKYGQDVKLLYLKEATIGFYLLSSNEHFNSLMEEIKSFMNSNQSQNQHLNYSKGESSSNS